MDIAHDFGLLRYDIGRWKEDKERRLHNYGIWHDGDQKKIVLRGKQKELEKLIGQGWYFIRDNGLTEIPKGSLTVVAYVPEYKSLMQKMVKRFQLL